ncbi:DUF2569 family protein [Sphingomonas sp. LHG3406-1]|uniref:DUF2569 family protein n=1 Tax=Sphingomonas sp. LHG3406-1 TaxID=2804617 RepID=UPI002605962E|nr:DUF2569 family protein [Sphingomonas sp. LHG3406-1]
MKTVPVIASVSRTLHRRSLGVLELLEVRLPQIMLGWFAVVAIASILRVAISPVAGAAVSGAMLLPYLLLIGAPLASLLLALRWFENAEAMPQPQLRLAIYGRWRNVTAAEAARHPLFGTSGIMVSLLVGMLMNVPFRAAEYLMTMPALATNAPAWLSVLHFWMTFDVVLISSLYVICFAAAFRRAPVFPRLLVLVWLLDIAMQLVIAQGAVAADLPASVAGPLHDLLEKNVTKVLISMGLWLPYLILSTRVNVTYRRRIPA